MKTAIILAALAAAVMIPVLAGGHIGSSQATPTSTPTPTPTTFPSTIRTFVNDTGELANSLYVSTHAGYVSLLQNAPGCPTPSISTSWPIITDVLVSWPDPCVDPGESVTMEFFSDCFSCNPPGVGPGTWALNGGPGGPTPTPTPTPTPAPAVEIDIKPGSDPNPVNLSCHGVIPVAILTTIDFDAATVDPDTASFEGAAPKHSALEDVDGDGDTDMILHFRCQEASIEPDAEEACLQGSTYDGTAFEACDWVRIVPPDSPSDSDSDGFTDAEEVCVGTDLLDDCPDDLTDDAWPADLAAADGYGKHDGEVNILDIVQLTPPYFNTSPPDPNYSTRKDFNGDGEVNILDIVRVTPPTFNTSCTP